MGVREIIGDNVIEREGRGERLVDADPVMVFVGG